MAQNIYLPQILNIYRLLGSELGAIVFDLSMCNVSFLLIFQNTVNYILELNQILKLLNYYSEFIWFVHNNIYHKIIIEF